MPEQSANGIKRHPLTETRSKKHGKDSVSTGGLAETLRAKGGLLCLSAQTCVNLVSNEDVMAVAVSPEIFSTRIAKSGFPHLTTPELTDKKILSPAAFEKKLKARKRKSSGKPKSPETVSQEKTGGIDNLIQVFTYSARAAKGGNKLHTIFESTNGNVVVIATDPETINAVKQTARTTSVGLSQARAAELHAAIKTALFQAVNNEKITIFSVTPARGRNPKPVEVAITPPTGASELSNFEF